MSKESKIKPAVSNNNDEAAAKIPEPKAGDGVVSPPVPGEPAKVQGEDVQVNSSTAVQTEGGALLSQGTGNMATSEEAQIERATSDNPGSTAAYDNHYNSLQENRAVEGGQMKVGSGIHKGRLIKEDGSIDYDSPSDLENRLQPAPVVDKVDDNSESQGEKAVQDDNQ